MELKMIMPFTLLHLAFESLIRNIDRLALIGYEVFLIL